MIDSFEEDILGPELVAILRPMYFLLDVIKNKIY